ncbi:hypothetical protein EXW72_26005 [Pseudomonas sp. BCA14]|uniref:hypothetical protein n=1 Tax=unclassified Pseudomonas TaxID=196821 RepID=UPI00106E001F|nr:MULTISPECIES: hypothetical protein [unclassified Pseudomonas]TFF02359.1 hypothetical protein EXW70_27525 [Pseudomonas sp. JMN1]TFF04577.1 hypothetical protein EXW71_26600 [Pseudomonas sp. BCA17]TFF18974.1 hypothetical protein EXW72_26005 [Pseudomonas sp. BCA14]TFF20264.1 hypothetical protein EXW73_24360 [Pseudomonas sp. BCA13]
MSHTPIMLIALLASTPVSAALDLTPPESLNEQSPEVYDSKRLPNFFTDNSAQASCDWQESLITESRQMLDCRGTSQTGGARPVHFMDRAEKRLTHHHMELGLDLESFELIRP